GPRLLVNTAPVPRRGIPAYGVGPVCSNSEGVVVIRAGDTISVENSALRAVLDSSGAISSLVDRTTGRESIAPGARGALLQLHRDTPNAWDAWDIDEFYRRVVRDLEAPTGVEVTEEGAGVRVSFTYSTSSDSAASDSTSSGSAASGSTAVAEGTDTSGVTGAGSTIVKTYVLRPEDKSLEIVHDIDWRERKKALKLAFGFDVRAATMSSETQFGHIDRPIPVNTSWDFARFETCAHRWVHLAEGGYGVAIANDSTYGHDVLRTLREADGGTTTTTRLTLVRAPEFPDPGADHGRYTLRVAVRPGAGIAEAIEEGYRLNLPERAVSAAVATTASAPLVTVDASSVLVETVKLAEDRSGDLVVRLYESAGARASTRVQLDAALGGGEVSVVDLLERPFPEDAPAFRSALERTGDGADRSDSTGGRVGAASAWLGDGAGAGDVELTFHPFEIKTLRITRRG
ncbi:MAG: glycoside hydrolase family 38 C-terminal domain-containing protein, partial [Brachybacterium tyrofermentans]